MSDQEETEPKVCPLCLETLESFVIGGDLRSCDFCGSDLTTVEVGNETVILVKQV